MKFRSLAVVLLLAASLPIAAPAMAQSSGASIAVAQSQTTRAQTRLAELGLYTGEITGRRNRAFERALERYQVRNQLAVTGTLTPETVEELLIPGTE